MILWTAEITNAPERDYALYLELLEDDQPRARIERKGTGELYLSVYPSKDNVDLPASWIRALLIDSEKML